MVTRKQREIYEKALELWGRESQIMMLFEEMGELQQAVSKLWRSKNGIQVMERSQNVIEEIVDVQIMLEQLKVLVNLDESFYREKRIKKLRNLRSIVDRL